MWMIFLKGLIIGFSIAAPVGPIGILCIKRTFSKGIWAGFITGLGAALADTFYGLIAAFSLTFIFSGFLGQKLWLQGIGMIFLFYLGIRIFLEKECKHDEDNSKEDKYFNDKKNIIADFFSAFVLTLTNPLTVVSFTAIFAAIGLNLEANSILLPTILVFGVFLGSILWWGFLSLFIAFLEKRFI